MAFETHPFTTALLVEIPTLHTLPITTARWHDVPLQRVEFPTLRPADLNAFLQQVEEEGGAAARASLPTASTWAFHEPLGRDELQPGDTAAQGHPLALTLVEIPAGTFLMGSHPEEPERSSDEGPQHEVTLASYFISQTPITQAQWRAVAGWRERPGERWGRELDPQPSFFQPLPNPNARSYREGRFALLPAEITSDLRPVDNVSWHDAIEFCSRLSQRSGRTYTLPSEAQWEYACRAETNTPFCFGNTISPELANYDGNHVFRNGPKGIYRKQTTPVGMFPANTWGLHDMHGNVWEWCLDKWHESSMDTPDNTYGETTYKNWRIRVTPTRPGYMYETAAPGLEFTGILQGLPHESIDECLRTAKRSIDAVLEQSGSAMVAEQLLRGGSWGDDPGFCRSAYRFLVRPGFADSYVGFRVVCLPQGPSLNP